MELAIRRGEPVIIEQDGNAVAAVIPIDPFEMWFRERENDQPSLIDELLENGQRPVRCRHDGTTSLR